MILNCTAFPPCSPPSCFQDDAGGGCQSCAFVCDTKRYQIGVLCHNHCQDYLAQINSTTQPPATANVDNQNSKVLILVIVGIVALVVALITFITLFLLMKRRKSSLNLDRKHDFTEKESTDLLTPSTTSETKVANVSYNKNVPVSIQTDEPTYEIDSVFAQSQEQEQYKLDEGKQVTPTAIRKKHIPAKFQRTNIARASSIQHGTAGNSNLANQVMVPREERSTRKNHIRSAIFDQISLRTNESDCEDDTEPLKMYRVP